MRRALHTFGLAACLLIIGCSDRGTPDRAATDLADAANPLLSESTLPYGYPQFDLI